MDIPRIIPSTLFGNFMINLIIPTVLLVTVFSYFSSNILRATVLNILQHDAVLIVEHAAWHIVKEGQLDMEGTTEIAHRLIKNIPSVVGFSLNFTEPKDSIIIGEMRD